MNLDNAITELLHMSLHYIRFCHYLLSYIFLLQTDNDPPHSFSQVFHLKQNPSTNSLVVLNDVFRLMLHHG